LSPAEYVAGGARLRALALRYQPGVIAFLGIGAYRSAFAKPQARLGLQTDRIGETSLWVLPSPSGLNANHQLADLVSLMRELREWVESSSPFPSPPQSQ
ncbi:MAG: uracil-DNA glycosylase family protein, partial [Gemmatimonas sp.]